MNTSTSFADRNEGSHNGILVDQLDKALMVSAMVTSGVMSSAVVPTVVTAEMMSVVMAAEAAIVTPTTAITITVAVRCIKSRYINVGCRGVAIVFAAAMAAPFAMAVPVASGVCRLKELRLILQRGRHRSRISNNWCRLYGTRP